MSLKALHIEEGNCIQFIPNNQNTVISIPLFGNGNEDIINFFESLDCENLIYDNNTNKIFEYLE